MAQAAGRESVAVTASEDGSFTLQGLGAGTYRLRASWLDGDVPFSGELEVEAGEPYVRIELAEVPRRLTVLVRTPEGKPVPRFNARVLVPGGYRSLGSLERGEVAFQDLGRKGPLPWTGTMLEIWGARDFYDCGLGLAPKRVPLGAERGTLDVVLAPGTVMQGVVTDPGGPRRQVEITMAPAPRWDGLDPEMRWGDDVEPDWPRGDVAKRVLPLGLPFAGVIDKVRTDEDGRFRIAFLQAAVEHELSLSFGEDYERLRDYVWNGRRTVRVGDEPVEFRLLWPVPVRITVLGPDGTPVHGAFVRVGAQDCDGFEAHGPWGFGDGKDATDAEGTIVFDRLHPERHYKLFVNPYYRASIDRTPGRSWVQRGSSATAAPNLAEAAVLDWTPKDTTVRLARGYAVSGRVMDADGKPVKDRDVGLCTPVGFHVYSTGSDGRFLFRGLPAGLVYLGLDDGGTSALIVDRQRVWMWAASYGGDAPGAPDPHKVPAWTKVDVADDVSDVALVVPTTRGVSVTLPARLTREFEDKCVYILRETDVGWVHLRREVMGFQEKSRTVIVDGLRPGGRYAAWMTPIQGRYAYAEFDGNQVAVVLERVVGRAIRGRVSGLPQDATRVVLGVWDKRNRFAGSVTTDPNGTFEFEGLPDSTWTVRARCRSSAGAVFEAEGSVATGETVELRLAPAQAAGK